MNPTQAQFDAWQKTAIKFGWTARMGKLHGRSILALTKGVVEYLIWELDDYREFYDTEVFLPAAKDLFKQHVFYLRGEDEDEI